MLAHARLYSLAPEVRVSYAEVVRAQAQTDIGRLRQTCSYQARKHEALDTSNGRLVFKRRLLKCGRSYASVTELHGVSHPEHGAADTQIWKWNRPQGPQWTC